MAPLSSSPLEGGFPLDNLERGDTGATARELTFQKRSLAGSIARAWKKIVKKVTQASTGTPSNGLDRTQSIHTDSSYGFPATITGTQHGVNVEEGSWVVDEVFVSTDRQSEFEEVSPSANGSVKSKQSTWDRSSRYHYRTTMSIALSVRYTIWAWIVRFFNPKFRDPDREAEFQKQAWYMRKRWAFFGALYLVLNWALYLALNHPNIVHSLYSQIVYYGVLTLFTLPTPFMVAFDMPAKSPVLFQIWFTIAVWWCGITEIIQIKYCHFYTQTPNQCFGKDFLAMLYYVTALPALMMFSVSRRLYNFIMQIIGIVLISVLILPDQVIFTRNLINFIIFHMFIQGILFNREINDRRIFKLTDQLKFAYAAQQRAQLAESKANDAKTRFASYIFHEVRVPLNVAQLAFDNLINVFKSHHVKSIDIEVYAIGTSLHMMKKVLNDALDLNKMDRGHFENVPRPFPLHQAIRSVMGPIGIATAAKALELKVDLDPRIDQLSHSGPLWIVGDEDRLKQIVTNLASNAVKFTPEGSGEIRVVTKLLSPKDRDQHSHSHQGSLHRDLEGNSVELDQLRYRPKHLVFRMEVHDSGPGVSPEDLKHNRLFQPFIQAEAGRGAKKGTGLGLAIVRQIVSLSGGRLGVSSHKGSGANFWIEMSYPFASPQQIQAAIKETTHLSSLNASSTAPHASPKPPSASPAPFSMVDIGLEELDKDAHLTANSNDSLQFKPQPSPGLSDVMTPGESAPMFPPGFTPDEDNTKRLGAQTPEVEPERPIHVLLVDDDAITRAVMSRTFSSLGCVVDTAIDGQHFLDIMTNPSDPKTYDLITLDNYMPVLSGEQAIEKFRAMGRTEFVVGCTGNALDRDRQRYLEAGVDDLLPKPLDRAKLQKLLDQALQRRNKPPDTRQ